MTSPTELKGNIHKDEPSGGWEWLVHSPDFSFYLLGWAPTHSKAMEDVAKVISTEGRVNPASVHEQARYSLQLHAAAQAILVRCFLWTDFLTHVKEENKEEVLDEMIRIVSGLPAHAFR